MVLDFRPFDRRGGAAGTTEADALSAMLAGEDWPFHAGGRPTVDEVLVRIAGGDYDGPATRTFWIVENGSAVGVLRLQDLDDDTPLFDLRLVASARLSVLSGLSRHRPWGVSLSFLSVLGGLSRHRPWGVSLSFLSVLGGLSRHRPWGHGAVLRRCGYVKESHWRRSWPGADGTVHDGTGYAILRADWTSGRSTLVEFDDEPG